MVQDLVKLLEYRFNNMAHGDEKQYILNLLQLYYPILQNQMKLKTEIKQSKMNLYNLESDCMHRTLTKEKNNRYIYKCIDCGKPIFK